MVVFKSLSLQARQSSVDENSEFVSLPQADVSAGYGSMNPKEDDDDNDNDNNNNNNNDDDNQEEGIQSEQSFHAARFTKPGSSVVVQASNILVSSTRRNSFLRHVSNPLEYRHEVPEFMQENIALVCDENILYHSNRNKKGLLYYAQDAFYNPTHVPEYVLTISPQIYQDMLEELHQSQTVPCGMYFCCQGGAGAVAGAAGEEDVVDIQLAQGLIATLFITMVLLSIFLPS